jgi:hypothetical protein
MSVICNRLTWFYWLFVPVVALFAASIAQAAPSNCVP